MAPMECSRRASCRDGPVFSPPYQPLVVVLLAVTAGIISDRFWSMSFCNWWLLAALGVLAWLAVRWWIASFLKTDDIFRSGGRRELFSSVPLLLAVMALGGAWEHCRWSLVSVHDLGRYARRRSQPVCIECQALQSPRRLPLVGGSKPSAQPLTSPPPLDEAFAFEVKILRLRNGVHWQPASGRAVLRVSGGRPNVNAGDQLRCFAQLTAPSGRENPGGSDPAARLRAVGIFSKLHLESPQCLTVLQPAAKWHPRRLLYRLRDYSSCLLQRYLADDSAERSTTEHEHTVELAQAILLGQRRQLDPQLVEDFLVTGTIHLLVVSGLHVGILAGAVFWLFRRISCKRIWPPAVTIPVVLVYLLVVDSGPAVVRATIMILTFFAAAALGRNSFSFNTLAAGGLVVLALNPNDLFHTGAQLSFLSTAGLMWHASHRPRVAKKTSLEKLIEANLPRFQRALSKLGRTIRELMLISFRLWLLTMPLVMSQFHICSPIGVVLNPFLWWPTAASLLGGFLLLICGSFLSPLAELLGGFCRLNLWLLAEGVNFARNLPAGYFWLPGPSGWWLWGFYGGLGCGLAFPRLRPPRRWRIGLLSAWIAIGLLPSLLQPAHSSLDCTFLNMGHGTAVLLELPSGKKVLYDAGRMGMPGGGARAVAEALWSRGIVHLDAVFLSHADFDHYNALPDLLERFSVGVIYTPPRMLRENNPNLLQLRQAIERHKTPYRELSAGRCLLDGGNCRLKVLHPPARSLSGGNNSNSLVLLVECFGQRILLTGDLESVGMEHLLSGEPQDCEVLLAPHHGSQRSNSPRLAAWCRPQWVIISGDGRWEAPELEGTFAAHGGQVVRTWQSGAIRVQVTPAGPQAWDIAGNLIKRHSPQDFGPYVTACFPDAQPNRR